MRILILALVAYIAAVVSFWRPAGTGDEAEPEDASPGNDREAFDGDLSARLSEAATTFGSAAEHIAVGHSALKASVKALSGQCSMLAARASEDEGFARRNRAPVLRLLFPLYAVVRRSTDLSRRDTVSKSTELLDNAAVLISGATEALCDIAERADDTALRHLETDLEVLQQRLSGEV